MDYYKQLIENMDRLPTLPKIYTALLKMMSNPNSTVDNVASLISQDQAATVQVIKTVNSPFFGMPVQIDSIKDAIMRLGFNEIKNLVLALSMVKTFTNTGKKDGFNLNELWKHSLAVGVATRLLGIKIGVRNTENYFLAGIVHDVGKLFFLEYFPKEYLDAVQSAFENKTSIEEAEIELFGISHTAIGFMLAEKWQLPDSIAIPIKYHSEGLYEGRFDSLIACVHVGNILARALELGHPGDNLIHRPNKAVWEHLELQENALTDISKRLLIDFENTSKILLG